ncbi:MAG: 50S ribosomal protein L24 [Candidatus Paceibacterota bacterium]
MKIKKGDIVIVISGKDKGKEGKITKALPKEERVVVLGVNVKKKHRKATRRGESGQIVEIAAPIHVSNVMLKDPKTGKRTRAVGLSKKGE